ncbi:MAG: hypothetical protein ACON4B_04785 [Flavobacteriaceae bacterium]
MNKKDILTDFCIHLLLLGDEFRDAELHFFDKKDKSVLTYQDFVDTINKFLNVEDFLWDTDIDKPISKISSLYDLITDKEIEFLQDFIYKEFSFGYPNEINEDGFAWGETHKLNLSIQDIISFFNDYLDLRSVNPNSYISYYQQFLNHLQKQINSTISATKFKIDNFYKNKNSIDTGLYSELKDNLESELKAKLLESTQSTIFQLQGGFDDFGFIFNYGDTLKTILELHSPLHSKLNLKIDPKQYFTLIEYEYYRFKIEGKKTTTKTENQKELKKEFELLKENNSKLVEFLKAKKFDNREVEIIINCFSFNKFNSLNIRHIRSLSNINYFGLFYLFYRFDFLKQELDLVLDVQNDFLKAPLIEKSDLIDKNMYFKYYKHSEDIVPHNQVHHKDFPFKQIKPLLNKIKKELHIDLKKLNIPPSVKNI